MVSFEEAAGRAKAWKQCEPALKAAMMALFKQQKNGDGGDAGGDATAKAWAAIKGMSKEDAQKKYVEIFEASNFVNMCSKAEKISELSCCTGLGVPERATAVVVFGSSRPEVPLRLAELIKQQPQLIEVPILITGTEAEVQAISSALGNGNHSSLHLDTMARNTDDNARFIVSRLQELNVSEGPIVYVNFPVLARGGLDALVHHGLSRDLVWPAFPGSAINSDDPTIKDGWVDAKLKQASEGKWAGKIS